MNVELTHLLVAAVFLLAISAAKAHQKEKFVEIVVPGYDYSQSPMQQYSIASQAIQDGLCDELYQAFIADPTNTEKEQALMTCKGQQNLLVGKIGAMVSGGSGRTG